MQVFFVLHQQYRRFFAVHASCLKIHYKITALRYMIRYMEVGLVCRGNFLADVQSKSGSLSGAGLLVADAVEFPEHPWLFLVADAAALVGYLKPQAGRCFF